MKGSWIPADFFACLLEHSTDKPHIKKTQAPHRARGAESRHRWGSTSTLLHWLNEGAFRMSLDKSPNSSLCQNTSNYSSLHLWLPSFLSFFSLHSYKNEMSLPCVTNVRHEKVKRVANSPTSCGARSETRPRFPVSTRYLAKGLYLEQGWAPASPGT